MLGASSRSKRQIACQVLADFKLTPRVEAAVRTAADSDGIADVRRAARKALLHHWGRSRGSALKSESAQISEYLGRHGITTFFHITAKRNMGSIHATGGILSATALALRGIKPIRIADRRRDTSCGTNAWVHLCLHPNQPMFYSRIPAALHNEFVVLDISTELATWGPSVFSDENAIASRALLGPDLSDLQRLKLECFAQGVFTDQTKGAWQAEILVHEMVPLKSIVRERSYAEVLSAHRANVPLGAKLEFLDRQAGAPFHNSAS